MSKASATKLAGLSYISYLSVSLVLIKLSPTSRIKFGKKLKKEFLKASKLVVKVSVSSP